MNELNTEANIDEMTAATQKKADSINKILADPNMKEVVVMEYEKMSRKGMLGKLKSTAAKQGLFMLPNWLALALVNIALLFIFGLVASAIMLSQNPPGASKSTPVEALKKSQPYNASCFSFDESCDSSKKLWCVDDRCQCYDQLAYWNDSSNGCVYCPTTFYYDGTTCACPSSTYLHSSSNKCRYYQNVTQSCNSSLLCSETRGLQCINSTCQCSSGYYWNSTTNNTNAYCEKYSMNTESCSTSANCYPGVSLTCINGTCQCSSSSNTYWTGSKCAQIQSFNGSCIYNQDCDGTVELICNNSRCICAGSTPYGTWFWNGTRCVLCPLGWLNYQIYCYYPSAASATWADARVYCQLYGAELLVIKTQAEFNFIEPYAVSILGSAGLGFIGYYTNVTTYPGVFSWLDSTMPTFSATSYAAPGATRSWWCSGQPNFLSSSNTPRIQSCGTVVRSGSSICFNDRWCWETLPFICKKSQ